MSVVTQKITEIVLMHLNNSDAPKPKPRKVFLPLPPTKPWLRDDLPDDECITLSKDQQTEWNKIFGWNAKPVSEVGKEMDHNYW